MAPGINNNSDRGSSRLRRMRNFSLPTNVSLHDPLASKKPAGEVSIAFVPVLRRDNSTSSSVTDEQASLLGQGSAKGNPAARSRMSTPNTRGFLHDGFHFIGRSIRPVSLDTLPDPRVYRQRPSLPSSSSSDGVLPRTVRALNKLTKARPTKVAGKSLFYRARARLQSHAGPSRADLKSSISGPVLDAPANVTSSRVLALPSSIDQHVELRAAIASYQSRRETRPPKGLPFGLSNTQYNTLLLRYDSHPLRSHPVSVSGLPLACQPVQYRFTHLQQAHTRLQQEVDDLRTQRHLDQTALANARALNNHYRQHCGIIPADNGSSRALSQPVAEAEDFSGVRASRPIPEFPVSTVSQADSDELWFDSAPESHIARLPPRPQRQYNPAVAPQAASPVHELSATASHEVLRPLELASNNPWRLLAHELSATASHEVLQKRATTSSSENAPNELSATTSHHVLIPREVQETFGFISEPNPFADLDLFEARLLDHGAESIALPRSPDSMDALLSVFDAPSVAEQSLSSPSNHLTPQSSAWAGLGLQFLDGHDGADFGGNIESHQSNDTYRVSSQGASVAFHEGLPSLLDADIPINNLPQQEPESAPPHEVVPTRQVVEEYESADHPEHDQVPNAISSPNNATVVSSGEVNIQGPANVGRFEYILFAWPSPEREQFRLRDPRRNGVVFGQDYDYADIHRRLG